MTIEQHLIQTIGDLVITIAGLRAELDALREQLPPASTPPPPAA
jgi:hypothetical protein